MRNETIYLFKYNFCFSSTKAGEGYEGNKEKFKYTFCFSSTTAKRMGGGRLSNLNTTFVSLQQNVAITENPYYTI